MVRFRKSMKVVRFGSPRASGLLYFDRRRGARVSVNSKGQVRRTVGIPGTGIYDTKVVNSKGRHSSGSSGGSLTTQSVHLTALDATGGRRDLFQGDPDVALLKIVGINDLLGEAVRFAGLSTDKPKAIRDGALVPTGGGEYGVMLIVQPDDNLALFGRGETTPRAMQFCRVAKRDADRWTAEFKGRPIAVVIFLEGTPGIEYAEVRLRASLLAADTEAESPAEAAAPVNEAPATAWPAAWYPDPRGQSGLRWWDGTTWAEDTHS
jgi:hypothetical protein